MGESVDDFVVQTKSKTDETIRNFTAVASNAYKGVSVLDDNGNLRNTYDILLDISKVYKEIQEEDKKYGTNRASALVEALAGKNRSNIASSILLNGELLENVYNSAQTSKGSAQDELNKYLESTEGRIAQFKNKIQDLTTSAISDDFVNTIIDAGTDIATVLDWIIDRFGLLIPLITTVGAGAGIKKFVENFA